MDTLVHDLRYALRLLLRAPWFTLTAIVVIAIGVGANSAIFSLVDALLLRPLPYAQPEQLVKIWEHPPGYSRNSASVVTFMDWSEQNKVFSGMAAIVAGAQTLTAPDRKAERIPGQGVTVGFFDLFGVRPVVGRLFTADDNRPDALVVVISERLWKSRFGSDAGLIGRQIMLNGVSRTVVGVVPDYFQLEPADQWTPFVTRRTPTGRVSHYLRVFARLKPDQTVEQARADMAVIAEGIAAISPATNKGWGVTIDTLRNAVVGEDRRTTSLMLAAVAAMVLLMGCANVASLLLARGIGRTREMAVRASLGVTPGRLIRQLLTESVLLAALGGAAGIALAAAIVRAAPSFIPPGTLPVGVPITLDLRVMIFAVAATLATGVLFGMAPALQATRFSLADTLRSGGRSATSGAGFRTALAAAEIAIAVTLTAGAGLMLRTLESLNAVDSGVRTENVLTVRMSTPGNKHRGPEYVPMLQEMQRRIAALPGVKSVGMGMDLPLDGWNIGQSFFILGQPMVEESQRPSAHFQMVNPAWFDSLGITITAGRAFNEHDTEQSPSVCIVNEELARRYLRGVNPLGTRISVPGFNSNRPPEREIVGVTRQVKVQGLGEKENAMEVYVPYTQNPLPGPAIAIHAQSSPLALVPAVTEAIAGVDKDLPLTRIRTMEEVAAETIAQPRLRAVVVGSFAGLALTLAAVGVFGVLAFSVSQRRREFGIRMAIGAQPWDVLALVLRRGVAIVAAGVAAGVLGAAGLARFVESLLYGVQPLDPASFIAAAVMLSVVALGACVIPAWRAARTNPVAVLHEE